MNLSQKLMLMMLFVITLEYSAAQNKDYDQTCLGKNAFVFDPQMKMSDIQTVLDTLYHRQANKKSEFNTNRYAVFFMPGQYKLDVKVGYYMQIYGLGNSPDDVTIEGAVRSKSTSKAGHVLSNFWRSAENLSIVPTTDSANIWGVSQAAPLRRIHVKGDLQLHDGGYASGGFMADSKIDGKVLSGQQQQWFSRNTEWKEWHGGAWNMMFMGTAVNPVGLWPERPYTVIENTPVIREKPYLIAEQGRFYLVVPSVKYKSTGYSWGNEPTVEKKLDISTFYRTNPATDNSTTLNQALKKGMNILFTPGIYQIASALRVTQPGTILTGIGLATLVSTNGNSIIETEDVDGLIISGIMFDAGKTPSETLCRIGNKKSGINHSQHPNFLYDLYFRVGGPFEGSTSSCLIINSNNVIIDNTWLWRADHGNGVGWTKNKSANGLIVNGDNVTAYGLFNEHFQEYQTIWNGNGGKVYFYQSEMPYDPPKEEAWMHNGIGGYASYKVADHVTSHEAWGLGVYCVFRQCSPIVDTAIETPKALESNIHHTVTFWLTGDNSSAIQHIINQKGNCVNKVNRKATLD